MRDITANVAARLYWPSLGSGVACDVFISYASADKLAADAVCSILERNGLRCWLAPRDVLPGMPWGESIVEAIGAARVMIVLLSTQSNLSKYVLREVERAVSYGKTIVPVRIEDVKPSRGLELFISSQHWLDALTPPFEAHIQQLAEMLKVLSSYNAASGVEQSAPVPRPEPSTQPESELKVLLEREFKPGLEPVPTLQPEPEPEPRRVPTPQPEPEPEPRPVPAPRPRRCPPLPVIALGIALLSVGVVALAVFGFLALRGRPPWSVVYRLNGPSGNVVRGLAIASSDVFLASDDGVSVLSSSGDVVTAFPEMAGAPEIGRLNAITLDSDNNVYVLDSELDQIVEFGPGGEFVSSWGSSGTQPGQLQFDTAVYGGLLAADHQGNVYIADLEQSRIQLFRGDGTFVRAMSAGQQYQKYVVLAVDSHGSVWALDNSGVLTRLAPDLSVQQQVTVDVHSDVATEADDMTLDDQGDFFLLGSGANELEELSPSGQLLQRWTVGGLGQPDRPYALAWDESGGGLYVASSRTLFRLNLST